MRVIGVDGCRGGWVTVAFDSATGTPEPRVHASFQQVLDSYSDAVAIAVDIPIGLSEGQDRACDVQARKVLRHRHVSVFTPPDPRVLFELTYDHAKIRSEALIRKRLSQQAFHIRHKIAEVNWAMLRQNQDRIFEVHPEVSFWALAGRPMEHPKDKVLGYEERRAVITSRLGWPIWSRRDAFAVARPALPDDLLDATVAAWTAKCVSEGNRGRLPDAPIADARGLLMEIVYGVASGIPLPGPGDEEV